MGSHGIKDRVAIVGMSCTRFGERWDKGIDELMVEAAQGALASARIEKDTVDAYWLGTAQSGMSGLMLSRPLQVNNKPVTRVENFCASGSEAFRQAAYAVASGAYDVAMAVGAEKLKDAGYQGANAFPIPSDGTNRTVTAAAMYSMIVPAYAQRFGIEVADVKRALAHIASKNHHNGARNPRAQFRKEMPVDKLLAQPRVAGELSVFDCAGVADGGAAAIVVRAEDALKYTDKPLYVKALSFVVGDGSGVTDPDYDFTTFPEVVASAEDAYRQAGITKPREEIAMAEVHDCFTPTEMVLMEDLGFSERGRAWQEVLDGVFDLDGQLPVNPDGGLKSFGHPVGASGLRMMFEAWLQMRGEAPEERRIAQSGRGLAMTHNLGGYPGEMVSFVSILGTALGDGVTADLPVARPSGERSLLDVPERVATTFADHEAYVDGPKRFTYQELAARSVGAAQRLKELGVRKGDVVAIRLPSCVEYAVAYLGVLRLGAIATGINPRLGPREIDAIMDKATPSVVVVEGDVDNEPRPALTRADLNAAPMGDLSWRPADVGPDTPAAIVWTSGTSGVPKGALFDHSNLEALSRATGELSAPFDRRLSSVPFAHVGYMTRVWDEIGNAMASVIVPTPWTAATALDLMETERITVGQGVPTQWELILRQPGLDRRDLSALRLISTGAAKVPASLVFELQRTFNVPVVVRYASTEASVISGTLRSDPPDVIEQTVGGACPTVELRITDDDGGELPVGEVGMIEVRSGAVMRGYFRHDGASPLRSDGWLITGDAGSLDADGRVHLVGRRSEMYIRGGYNIYPLEVELVLVEHPKVAEVAIAGVPDEVLGSRAVAWVVPADADSPPELVELRAWVKQNLADYKAPDRLVITDSLPRNQMGKVDKKALLAQKP